MRAKVPLPQQHRRTALLKSSRAALVVVSLSFRPEDTAIAGTDFDAVILSHFAASSRRRVRGLAFQHLISRELLTQFRAFFASIFDHNGLIKFG
jgi:hypothetical protein